MSGYDAVLALADMQLLLALHHPQPGVLLHCVQFELVAFRSEHLRTFVVPLISGHCSAL